MRLISADARDTSWSGGGQEVCSWGTERIVMDERGTCVVQSVRRVPEEQRYDNRLLQSVRGTPWEPNPGENVYIRKVDVKITVLSSAIVIDVIDHFHTALSQTAENICPYRRVVGF